MKHKREVQLFSKALFYGPSALRGLPSPGEQYCELMPVMADSPSPSRFASRLFYICHVFGGYGLTLVAKKFKSMAVGMLSIVSLCLASHAMKPIDGLVPSGS